MYNQIRIGTGEGIWRKSATEKSVSSGVAYAPSASHVISAEMSFNAPGSQAEQANISFGSGAETVNQTCREASI